MTDFFKVKEALFRGARPGDTDTARLDKETADLILYSRKLEAEAEADLSMSYEQSEEVRGFCDVLENRVSKLSQKIERIEKKSNLISMFLSALSYLCGIFLHMIEYISTAIMDKFGLIESVPATIPGALSASHL